ncbi:hypothetical protein FACS1894191_0100 [Clostridia bacterium]|nr:hypothetical protein FACS1894191_0100 [Clostridia bacterium]
MGNSLKKTGKSFNMPHVFIVILIIMLFISILTYIMPSGNYTRVAVEGASMPVVDPASYTRVENTPVMPLRFFTSIYQGFVESAGVIASVLLISGAIAVLQSTGTFEGGIQKMMKSAKGRELSIVIIFFTIFTFMGVIGYLDGLYSFYPILISIFLSIGYDRMVGTAVVMLSTAVGFTSGLVNIYTTGISQQIVGLPLFSGIGFRAIGLVVFYIIAVFFLSQYCIKIKKDPTKSMMGEEYIKQKDEKVDIGAPIPFTGKRIFTLALFVAVVAFSAFCSVNYGWGLPEITAMYFPLIIIAIIIFKIKPGDACKTFTNGMAAVVGPALVIGLSRAVTVLLNSGNIVDTFIKAMADVLTGKSPVITLLIIYLFIIIFDFFVSSGSGKAVMMMPILSPLGQILGINQQVLVLAYHYGDGIANTFWPSSSLVMLSLCGMDYGRWFKFAWKIYICITVAAFALIVIADKIGFGPF